MYLRCCFCQYLHACSEIIQLFDQATSCDAYTSTSTSVLHIRLRAMLYLQMIQKEFLLVPDEQKLWQEHAVATKTSHSHSVIE